VPQELKEKQRGLPLLSFSRGDEEIYSSGGGGGAKGRKLGVPMKKRKGKLAGGEKHDA